MGVARFESEQQFDHARLRVATVVTRTKRGNLHAGLLYRGPNNSRSALHLGWQDQLWSNWDFPVFWATPEVEPEQLVAAAGMCRLVWTRYLERKRFPWALNDLGARFDEQGRLVLETGAHGLTCATIILAIFRHAGVELLVRDTWPIRKQKDREWLDWAVAEGFFGNPSHLALITEEVGSGVPRVHPDEVVATCACTLPGRFKVVRKAADALVDRLDHKRTVGAYWRRFAQWARSRLGRQ